MANLTQIQSPTIHLRGATTVLAVLALLGLGLVAIHSVEAQSLTTAPAKAQSYTVIYNFGGYTGDGFNPLAGLLIDKAGNLYGTTYSGGVSGGGGTVFKLDTSDHESLLYSFGAHAGDGMLPEAAPIMDKAGNLYGTTVYGGSGNCNINAGSCGTVFKLDTSGTETVLHSFAGPPDGLWPFFSDLVMDSAGNFYGTTADGGSGSCSGDVELYSSSIPRATRPCCIASEPKPATGPVPMAA